MRIRHAVLAVTALASILAVGSASAQRVPPMTAWAPQPEKLAPFKVPQQALPAACRKCWAVGKHKGQKSWSQTMVLDRDYIADYIQMAPGEKTKTQFWADDRIFWVVQSGAIRFTIEGQDPFVATKGFVVQVPYRVPYSLETVGDEPSLRFEVRAAHEIPSFPTTETPPKIKGWKFVQSTYTGKGKSMRRRQQASISISTRPSCRKAGAAAASSRTRPYLEPTVHPAAAWRLDCPPTPAGRSHFHENFDEFLDHPGEAKRIS